MKTLRKGSNIHISGRRWFDRVYGNTYHSVSVHVNGEFVGSVDFAYGYDRMYEQTAEKIIRGHYKLPLKEHEALWHLRDYGIKLVSVVTDVQRKKDL